MNILRRGIVLSSDDVPPKMLLEYLGMIEDAGYELVVFPERWGRDAFTIIAQGMQVTSKLKFATGIVNIYSRSPAALAQTAASLAELSDGRFILGLGASGSVVIEQFHGVPYGKPLQRTRETIGIIRSLLAGERLDHMVAGNKVQHFKLSFDNEYDIPIYLASLGPKNLELTGELADGWYPIWASKSGFASLMKPINAGLQKGNRNRTDFTIAPFLMSCASEKSELTTKLARNNMAYYIGKMGSGSNNFYYQLAKRFGYGTEADKIQQVYSQDRDAAAKVITDKMLDDMVITGSIDDAKEKMAVWDELVDIPLIVVPHKTPLDVVYESLQAFAP